MPSNDPADAIPSTIRPAIVSNASRVTGPDGTALAHAIGTSSCPSEDSVLIAPVIGTFSPAKRDGMASPKVSPGSMAGRLNAARSAGYGENVLVSWKNPASAMRPMPHLPVRRCLPQDWPPAGDRQMFTVNDPPP